VVAEPSGSPAAPDHPDADVDFSTKNFATARASGRAELQVGVWTRRSRSGHYALVAFRRKKLRPVSDETIDFLRGIVERWAESSCGLRKVTLEREEVEHLLCTVRFNDRPDFTVILLWCANADRYEVEEMLVQALNESDEGTLELSISGIIESVIVEAYRPNE
jgi:hypothetical protein